MLRIALHPMQNGIPQSGYYHQRAMPTTLDSTLIVPLSTLVDRYNHNVVCTLNKCDFFLKFTFGIQSISA